MKPTTQITKRAMLRTIVALGRRDWSEATRLLVSVPARRVRKTVTESTATTIQARSSQTDQPSESEAVGSAMTTPTRPPQTSSSPRSESAAALGQRRPRASPYLRRRWTTRTWTRIRRERRWRGRSPPSPSGGRAGGRDHVKTAGVGRLGSWERSAVIRCPAMCVQVRRGAPTPCDGRFLAALGGRRLSPKTRWSRHRFDACRRLRQFSPPCQRSASPAGQASLLPHLLPHLPATSPNGHQPARPTGAGGRAQAQTATIDTGPQARPRTFKPAARIRIPLGHQTLSQQQRSRCK